MKINRSCNPERVKQLRKNLLKTGWVEAETDEEAQRLEAEGLLVFIDRTNHGANSYPEAEITKFRETAGNAPSVASHRPIPKRRAA